ncbi:hypothetical protein D3C86_2235300 [compost metagenome]
MVRAMSSALPPNSITETASASSSETFGPIMWTPRTLSVLASAITLMNPRVSL